MNYRLESSDQDGFKIILEFQTVTLGETVENIECFLKGCGFIFEELEIIEKEEDE